MSNDQNNAPPPAQGTPQMAPEVPSVSMYGMVPSPAPGPGPGGVQHGPGGMGPRGMGPGGLGPGGMGPGAATRAKTSRLAIVALVLACIVFLPIIPLIGVVLGIVAVAKLPSGAPGKGLAIAAIPTGAVVTLIHLMLAAIAIPAFVMYLRKSKAIEARISLDKIKAGARALFMQERTTGIGQPAARSLPAGSRQWTPSQSCCSQGGKCIPNANEWKAKHWQALHFAMSDPHYFQYRFYTMGSGRTTRVVIEARGDLDCDGTYSSYKLRGRVGYDGELQFRSLTRRRAYE